MATPTTEPADTPDTTDTTDSTDDAWVTFARVDSPCEAVLLPGRFHVGETVPCPDGDHTHRLVEVIHAEVWDTVALGDHLQCTSRR